MMFFVVLGVLLKEIDIVNWVLFCVVFNRYNVIICKFVYWLVRDSYGS